MDRKELLDGLLKNMESQGSRNASESVGENFGLLQNLVSGIQTTGRGNDSAAQNNQNNVYDDPMDIDGDGDVEVFEKDEILRPNLQLKQCHDERVKRYPRRRQQTACSSRDAKKTAITRTTRSGANRALEGGNIIGAKNGGASATGRNAYVDSNPRANNYLTIMIEHAEFELKRDPYRGMTQLSDPHDRRNHPRNLWLRCRCGKQRRQQQEGNRNMILNLDDCDRDDEDGYIVAKAWVDEVAHSQCPSLTNWTQQSVKKEKQASKKKRAKKRKLTENLEVKPPQVGQRPADPSAKCPCDYNPFCIASLGGIVSEIWQTKAEIILEKFQKQERHMQEMWKIQEEKQREGQFSDAQNDFFVPCQKKKSDPQPIVIDVDNSLDTSLDKGDHDDDIIEVQGTENTNKVRNMDADNDAGIEYSKETAAELKLLRPWTMVPVQPIIDYLSYLLEQAPDDDGLCNSFCVGSLLQIFTEWQQSLIFSNPFNEASKPTSSKIPISLPPGISNLGATCYLNTQLQCLAQNKDFLVGLGSWTPNASDGDKNQQHSSIMNSVLAELRKIMAKLVEGSQRTITTLEFSTALGLEHDEQQDPNEFARLLFERMHEAFQQQQQLKDLLPSLFEGTTSYETQCHECKYTSKRSETFMDLNLPIVRPEKDENDGHERKGVFRRTIRHFFPKKGEASPDSRSLPLAHADTDLQYCLDQYSTHEDLVGDNQYFCSNCNCKRNATRHTFLEKLPPVLNVQLSRYVFDRATYTKKKLTDKVLLPRKLHVETRMSDEAGDAFRTKTYVLCAVMKHQGTSAYRGHYVAEVQDFLSGHWFEFNDEKVTILEKGPSCSYESSLLHNAKSDDSSNSDEKDAEQSQKDNKKKRKAAKLEGSSDAYNMYYIEESHLAMTTIKAFNSLQQQLAHMKSIDKKGSPREGENFLEIVALNRENEYRRLGELCLSDGRASERLKIRKQKIRGEMLSMLYDGDNEEPQVWVDAELLRRFIGCEDRLEDLFRSLHTDPLLCHRHLLCNHEKPGLHPRIARRGKLLPESMYKIYCDLLAYEHGKFLDISRADSKVDDIVISPGKSLQCRECVLSYQEELKQKLAFFKRLISLYNLLDRDDSFVEVFDGHESDSEYEGDDEDVYVVSKKSLTAFRKKIESDLFKGLDNFLGMASLSSRSTSVPTDVCDSNETSFGPGRNVESLSEGLDAFDLSMFDFSVSEQQTASGLDPRLNSNITCRHGKSNSLYLKNQVKWLQPKVWNALKRIFPNAIEHKLPLNKKKNKECERCAQEEQMKRDITDKLKQWHSSTLSRGEQTLRILQSAPTGDNQINEVLNKKRRNDNEKSTASDYVVVARGDVLLWRKLVDIAGKLKKKKNADGHLIKSQIESLLQGKSEHWSADQNKPPEIAFFKSLRCARHSLPLPFFQKNEIGEKAQLPRSIQLLGAKQYVHFVTSFTDLFRVLSESETDQGVVIDLCNNEAPLLASIDDLPPSQRPPTVRLCRGEDIENGCDNCDKVQLARFPGITLELSPKACDDEQCCREYRDSLTNEALDEGLNGSAVDDPILLDSDNEEPFSKPFKIKVFELEKKATLNDALTSLLELEALPNAKTFTIEADDLPRRSTRKRKKHFPVGVVLQEDIVEIGLQHNLASLRLLLYQSLGDKFGLDEVLFLVFSPFASIAPDASIDASTVPEQCLSPKTEELAFEANQEILKDVYSKMANDPQLDQLVDPSLNLILLRRPKPEESSIPNELLMDGLFEASNVLNNENEPKASKRKPAERGFTGTLLSARAFAPKAADDEQSDKKDENLEDGSLDESCTLVDQACDSGDRISTIDSAASAAKESKSHSPASSEIRKGKMKAKLHTQSVLETIGNDANKASDKPRLGKLFLDEIVGKMEAVAGSNEEREELMNAAKKAVEQSNDNEKDVGKLADTAISIFFDSQQ